MDDNSVLKFGTFKGKKLANVPAWWLLWWYNQTKPLMNYIREHRAQLEKERENENKKKNG